MLYTMGSSMDGNADGDGDGHLLVIANHQMVIADKQRCEFSAKKAYCHLQMITNHLDT